MIPKIIKPNAIIKISPKSRDNSMLEWERFRPHVINIGHYNAKPFELARIKDTIPMDNTLEIGIIWILRTIDRIISLKLLGKILAKPDISKAPVCSGSANILIKPST